MARSAGYMDWANQPNPLQRTEDGPATASSNPVRGLRAPKVSFNPSPSWVYEFGTDLAGSYQGVEFAGVTQETADPRLLFLFGGAYH